MSRGGLIDAQTDTHLWAERFDRDAAAPFAVQDQITKRATVALYQALIDGEAARPPVQPVTLDYVLRGRVANLRGLGRDCYAGSISLFERALSLDPHSPEAQAWLAETLAYRAFEGIAEAAAVDIARAKGLGAQALAASPRSAFAHVAQGRVLCAQGRFEEAISEYEAANAINPGLPHHYGYLGACRLWTGSINDAIPLAERAMAISPRDPYRAYWYFTIGQVQLLHSRTSEAIAWFDKVHRLMPHFPLVHAWLAAACAHNGQIERARAELAEARGRSRDGRYWSIARLKTVGHFGVPKIRALVENTYLAGLRKAGMPEE